MENQTKTKRKFNIIDLIFIIIIVAAIVAVGFKFFGDASTTRSSGQYVVTLHSDDVPDPALVPVVEGAKMTDETGDIYLGKISEVVMGESIIYTTNSDGQICTSAKEGYSSVDIKITVNAVGNDHFITVGGTKYSINHGFTARCGMSKVYLRITDIQPVK
ncbi:MAG: DUF4330 family protein [Clostridia bacterium]|nr:DUF4330 family protein [Clostridia bacterium]